MVRDPGPLHGHENGNKNGGMIRSLVDQVLGAPKIGWTPHTRAKANQPVFVYIYIYIPGTQMGPLVLIGSSAFFWEG